ncbi:hypothetical protein G7Y79_00016g040100 [Physcia stellaris]|nr:hypothetical protein G7Y79_00016g040100 [Physcia stellaris]
MKSRKAQVGASSREVIEAEEGTRDLGMAMAGIENTGRLWQEARETGQEAHTKQVIDLTAEIELEAGRPRGCGGDHLPLLQVPEGVILQAKRSAYGGDPGQLYLLAVIEIITTIPLDEDAKR